MIEWTIVEETPAPVGYGDRNHLALVRHESGRGSVIVVNHGSGQVQSIIPADSPGGGAWTASLTDRGIEYVTSRRAWSTARRYYRQILEEYARSPNAWAYWSLSHRPPPLGE